MFNINADHVLERPVSPILGTCGAASIKSNVLNISANDENILSIDHLRSNSTFPCQELNYNNNHTQPPIEYNVTEKGMVKYNTKEVVSKAKECIISHMSKLETAAPLKTYSRHQNSFSPRNSVRKDNILSVDPVGSHSTVSHQVPLSKKNTQTLVQYVTQKDMNKYNTKEVVSNSKETITSDMGKLEATSPLKTYSKHQNSLPPRNSARKENDLSVDPVGSHSTLPRQVPLSKKNTQTLIEYFTQKNMGKYNRKKVLSKSKETINVGKRTTAKPLMTYKQQHSNSPRNSAKGNNILSGNPSRRELTSSPDAFNNINAQTIVQYVKERDKDECNLKTVVPLKTYSKRKNLENELNQRFSEANVFCPKCQMLVLPDMVERHLKQSCQGVLKKIKCPICRFRSTCLAVIKHCMTQHKISLKQEDLDAALHVR